LHHVRARALTVHKLYLRLEKQDYTTTTEKPVTTSQETLMATNIHTKKTSS